MAFRIDQPIFDEYGEWDDEEFAEYIDGLMEAFATSPEAERIIERYGGIGWTASLVEYGVSYLGATPADMSPRDLREIVFDIFPRKVSCEPESAEEIVAELRAFWSFAGRAYSLSGAEACLQALGDDAVDELEDELSDPSNFGMAKSFFMMGQAGGFDMTTQEGLDEFMLAYNNSLPAGRLADDETAAGDHTLPPLPFSLPTPQRPVPTSGSGPLHQRKKKLAKSKRAARKAKAKHRSRKGK